MNGEAIAAFLHYGAIFSLAGALMVEYALVRQPDVRPFVGIIARADLIYGIAALAVLLTGLARFGWYGKGIDFYLATWLFHAKVTLFILTALVSIVPTLRFLRWKKQVAAGGGVDAREQRSTRLLVLLELHLVFLIPLLAVFMARGYGQPG